MKTLNRFFSDFIISRLFNSVNIQNDVYFIGSCDCTRVGNQLLVYQQDKYEKEPHGMLLMCFLWGIVSTIPALLGQMYFRGTEDPKSLLITFLFSFFVIAVSEELSKFFFLRFYAYPKDAFNEPMDGIVYAVMVEWVLPP